MPNWHWGNSEWSQTDVAAGFVGVPVAEKLPQSMATEVGSGVEFTGNFPGFIFILQELYFRIASSGDGGLTGKRLSPSTWVCDFLGQCFTMKLYPSSAAEHR